MVFVTQGSGLYVTAFETHVEYYLQDYYYFCLIITLFHLRGLLFVLFDTFYAVKLFMECTSVLYKSTNPIKGTPALGGN